MTCKRHATSHERPPPFDDGEDGEFKGKGNAYHGEPGSWFVSQLPQRIDYMDLCKSRYRPGDFPAMLTRKHLKSTSMSAWHDAPRPLPHKFCEPHPCSIRFKMMGGAVRKMPWLQLDGQIIELHDTSKKIIKHFLGGRLSLIIEQLEWGGPWSEMMTSADRLRYTQLFRQMDVDNGGTVDGGELSFAFEQLGIQVTDAAIMQMVAKHAKKHEMEVTLNEFFEMMESQVRWLNWFNQVVLATRSDLLTKGARALTGARRKGLVHDGCLCADPEHRLRPRGFGVS